MKLTELEAQLYRYEKVTHEVDVITGDAATWRERGFPSHKEMRTDFNSVPVATIAEAQSIWFLCPKCFPGHVIECSLAGRGVEDACGSHNKDGKPTRWIISGSDLSNLSLQPSVLIEGGCGWHGFVTNGDAA